MSMSSEPVFPSVCCILVSRSPCVLVILYSSFPYNLFILVRVVGRFCHPEVGCAWLFCMLPKVSPSHVSKLSSILLLCNDLLAPAPDWELPHHQATIKQDVLGHSTHAQTKFTSTTEHHLLNPPHHHHKSPGKVRSRKDHRSGYKACPRGQDKWRWRQI